MIAHLHKCDATWAKTVLVHEVFRGKTVWLGDVEVFDLRGHPKAKRCYAWSHLDGSKDERTRYVAVLEIPPVESAETAVRVQIVKDTKQARQNAIVAEVEKMTNDDAMIDRPTRKQMATDAAIQMLEANISAMRFAIVRNKLDMLVEILNEMEKTLEQLKRNLGAD